MIIKEGDELGIEPIRARLETDQKLMEKAQELYGIPQIFLRNAIPVEKAAEYANDYELTSSYEYQWDAVAQKVNIIERPWIVKDDAGRDSVSLQAPAVTVSLIKQLAKVP